MAKIQACKRYYDKIKGVDPINTDGLTARQSYYQRNREKVIARQREYYQRNAHKVKERRVQHYRTKSEQNPEDIPVFHNSTGAYLEKHKEYYEKNKEIIKERRRNYYHMKKEALRKKVGKYEFAKITGLKNLAEIPDPFEAHGNVQIEIPTPLPPIQALKKPVKKSDESDEENNDHVTDTNASPLDTCLDYGLVAKPGNFSFPVNFHWKVLDFTRKTLIFLNSGQFLPESFVFTHATLIFPNSGQFTPESSCI